jgi:cyclic pyranopterin phosphate synthase
MKGRIQEYWKTSQEYRGTCRDSEKGVYSGPSIPVSRYRPEVARVNDFSHIDKEGKIKMVDVSGKPVSKRTAVASGSVRMAAGTVSKLREGTLKKGDALATARIAGIMGAKRTSDLIPLCHPLPVDDISLKLELREDSVEIEASVTSTARTGVEMEALTAVSVAALALYDMCKAVDKGMVIDEVKLISKTKEKV